jgi:hypothetical protein
MVFRTRVNIFNWDLLSQHEKRRIWVFLQREWQFRKCCPVSIKLACLEVKTTPFRYHPLFSLQKPTNTLGLLCLDALLL